MQATRWSTSRGIFDGYAAGPEDGEVVLLLHGFPQDAWQWRRQLPLLDQQGYRAMAPDGRGVSAAIRPTDLSAYAMPELVADVLAMADSVGAPRFHLVGHDWGGAVAWQTAARYPERVASLTVLSTPHPRAFARALRDPGVDQAERSSYMGDFRRPDAADRLLADDALRLRQLYELSGVEPDAIPHYMGRFRQRETLNAFLNWYRADDPADVDDELLIRVPTQYLWSDEDPALGQEAARWSDDYCVGEYSFIVVRDVGHWLPEQAVEVVNPRLIGHLRRHSGRFSGGPGV